MVFYLSLIILILALGAQLTLRSFGIRYTQRDSNIQIHSNSTNEENKSVDLQYSLICISKYFFYGVIILIFGNAFYLSYSQYKIWKYGTASDFTKFLLPPYQSINYFIGYSLFHFFTAHLISLVFAFSFLKIAKYYNKKFEERFFYPEEYYLGALAIFLSGFPGIFLYIISIFFASVLGSLILNKFSTLRGERVSFYYLWIPTAIFVIIISKWLAETKIWQLFKI